MRIFDWDNPEEWRQKLSVSVPSKEDFASQFYSRYQGIRLYHGSRLSQRDAESIRCSGLSSFSDGFLIEQFKSICHLAQADVPADKQFCEVMSRFPLQLYSKGRMQNGVGVDFAISRSLFERRGVEYTKRGSEFIRILAKEITRPEGYDYVSLVENHGTPCIVIAELQWDDIVSPYNSIANHAFQYLYENAPFDDDFYLRSVGSVQSKKIKLLEWL